MTNEEREQAIADIGRKIVQHVKDGDKNQALICFHLMMGLVAGRSAEKVAEMEQERGIK